jgi:hypothetical protein
MSEISVKRKFLVTSSQPTRDFPNDKAEGAQLLTVSRPSAKATAQDFGQMIGAPGADTIMVRLLKNNALLFAPRIVFRFC